MERWLGLFIHITSKPPDFFFCDVASGAFIHSHSLNVGILLSDRIWTQGESLRFATADTKTISIREVGFTPVAPPAVVETLLVPGGTDPFPALDGFDDGGRVRFQLLPAPWRLTIAFEGRLWYGMLGNTNICYAVRTPSSVQGCPSPPMVVSLPAEQPGRLFTSGRSFPLAIYFTEHFHPALGIPTRSFLESGNGLLCLVVA